jgi:predicted protein tyrosine phosphatase
MEQPRKLLFVCTANQQRSPTAEELYKNDPRFDVDSAGVATVFGRPVTEDRLRWADIVVVMEGRHEDAIRTAFPDLAGEKQFLVLGIPDVYEFMNPELQQEIKSRFERVYSEL